MCDSLSNEAGKLQWQPAAQLGDKAGQQGAAVQGSGSYGRAADVPVGKGSGLHTLCGEELSSCSSRDTNWVSSRTNILASSNSRSNLLPSGGITSSGGGAAAKGASKLGKSARGAAQGSAAAAAAVAAAAAAGSAGNNECAACTAKSQQAKQQQQQRPNIVQRFGQRHPLLCHIVWGQLQVSVWGQLQARE
jgi:hypothetical protein